MRRKLSKSNTLNNRQPWSRPGEAYTILLIFLDDLYLKQRAIILSYLIGLPVEYQSNLSEYDMCDTTSKNQVSIVHRRG